MKLTNIGILFAMIFLGIVLILDSTTNDLTTISNLQIQYNHALDNAIEAAIVQLVEVDNGIERRFNKEEAVKCFYDSLAINFDVLDQKDKKKQLSGYVPVIGIILEDGFYLYYDNEKLDEGENIVEKEFSEKYCYQYQEFNLIYYFTLTDYVRIYDQESGELYEGNYHDLAEVFPSTIMSDDIEYERIRRLTIINLLTDTIGMYINEHNRIAKHYGIEYNFTLPYIEKEDWYRTINDISMIAFFQGYPYGNSITGKYNRYAFAGARIYKEQDIE